MPGGVGDEGRQASRQGSASSVDNGYGITDSMYLNTVFAGLEIWSGADGASVEQFCANVE